ncbi:MAG: hypothetical protein NVSMB4_01330 [Acidimicrobiales bacterium]
MAPCLDAPTRPVAPIFTPLPRSVNEQVITRALESTARIVAGVAGLFGLPVVAVPPTGPRRMASCPGSRVVHSPPTRPAAVRPRNPGFSGRREARTTKSER